MEICEIEQNVVDFLLFAKEIASTHPDAAMLYCRKALECIIHHLHFLEKGEYPKEKPDGSRPGIVALLKILKNSIDRQTHTVLFSINAQTRGSMHWDEESRGAVAKKHHVKDVIPQIRSVFLDLFDTELSLEEIEIDEVWLEKVLKENIANDLSRISIEEQGEMDFSEEKLDEMDAILDVAEFATGKNIYFESLNMLELAIIAQLRGKISDSKVYFTKALEGFAEDMVKPIFRALSGLAECALDLGSPEEARVYWNKCREHARTHSDRHLESQAIGNLGLAYMREGELQIAKNLFIESMEIQRSERDLRGVATSFANLANIDIQIGSPESAIGYSIQAFQIFKDLNEIYGMINAIDQMGAIQGLLENWEIALQLHTDALNLSLCLEEPDMDSVAMSKGNIANCLRRLSRFEEAKTEYISVLELCEKSGYAYGLATSLINLGIVEFELGNLDTAEELFSRGNEVASESNDMQNKITSLNELALIARRKGDIDRAIALLEESIFLSEQHGYQRSLSIANKNLEAILDEGKSHEDS